MEALKIIESYREQLTQDGIVICTYILDLDGSEVDCISIEYVDVYPFFEIVIIRN